MAPAAYHGLALTGKNIKPLVGAAMAVVRAAFAVARRKHHLGCLRGAVAGDYAEALSEAEFLFSHGKKRAAVFRRPAFYDACTTWACRYRCRWWRSRWSRWRRWSRRRHC